MVMKPSSSRMARSPVMYQPPCDDLLLRQIVPAQIALHDVGAVDEQQALLARRQILQRLAVDDAHGDAGERLADGARLVADLPHVVLLPVGNVGGHGGRQLGAAIPFQRHDAELFLELLGQRRRQLLGAAHQDAQRCGNRPARSGADRNAGTSASTGKSWHWYFLHNSPISRACSGLG